MLLAVSMVPVLLAALLGYLDVRPQSQQASQNDTRADALIKRLWSPDEAERSQARADIIELNHSAVPGLVSLLEEITSHPFVPRFATGRQEEGRLLWQRFQNSLNTREVVDLTGVEISSRLKEDAIDMLGDLRASEAVPILIKIMQSRMKANWLHERWASEMEALQKIGKPAVSALVELVEATERRDSPPLLVGPSITPEEAAIFLKSSTATVLTRAVMVLGEIGEKEALPALERLETRCKDPQQACPRDGYIHDAITMIKAKE